jgi:hypothetical protein
MGIEPAWWAVPLGIVLGLMLNWISCRNEEKRNQ